MINEDQIEVYKAVMNMRLKSLVTICILIGFFVILVFVCIAGNWQDRTVFAALDGILGYTMVPLVKHFFPAVVEAQNAEKRSRKQSKSNNPQV